MIWISAIIFLPTARLTPAFIEEYINRYSVAITGPQIIDGVEMTLEPGEENTSLSIICVDNPRLAMFRKLSVYDGTLVPVPVYDPPLAEGEPEGEREPIGYTITAVWPEVFLADLQRDPQPEPGLFDGVHIV